MILYFDRSDFRQIFSYREIPTFGRTFSCPRGDGLGDVILSIRWESIEAHYLLHLHREEFTEKQDLTQGSISYHGTNSNTSSATSPSAVKNFLSRSTHDIDPLLMHLVSQSNHTVKSFGEL